MLDIKQLIKETVNSHIKCDEEYIYFDDNIIALYKHFDFIMIEKSLSDILFSFYEKILKNEARKC